MGKGSRAMFYGPVVECSDGTRCGLDQLDYPSVRNWFRCYAQAKQRPDLEDFAGKLSEDNYHIAVTALLIGAEFSSDEFNPSLVELSGIDATRARSSEVASRQKAKNASRTTKRIRDAVSNLVKDNEYMNQQELIDELAGVCPSDVSTIRRHLKKIIEESPDLIPAHLHGKSK